MSINRYIKIYGKPISGSDVSKEQVKRLKYNLLNALIEQKLLFNLISDLGLVIGEESIKDHISNTKYFQDDNGEFDKEKFYETLLLILLPYPFAKPVH
nr:SurA N-terminal domain-containing protein [Wolbachia endosymbiont of Atemnus politus]